MDCETFLEETQKLEFVSDRVTADSMVKTVLGMLASGLSEQHARKLTEKLPPPLDYERLCGHQQNVLTTPVENLMRALGAQFNIGIENAGHLFLCVLGVAKDATGSDVLAEVERNLPADWVETAHRA